MTKNEWGADEIKEALDTIDEHQERMLSERGKYMAFCKIEREKIAAVYDLAADNGISKRVLKRAHNRIKLRRKMENEKETLDTEMQEELSAIEKALASFESTPLGAAAKKAQRARPGA